MRQVGLLIVVVTCGTVLYDRLSGPPLAGLRAAQSSASSQSSASGETRLQKLQHYQVASQLLETEMAKYRDLRNAELKRMTTVAGKEFRRKLSKEMQEVWDRLNNEWAALAWRDRLPHGANEQALLDKEMERKDALKEQYKSFQEALTDPRSEAARSWEKVFEDLPAEKEIRAKRELIDLFTQERNEARAALK